MTRRCRNESSHTNNTWYPEKETLRHTNTDSHIRVRMTQWEQNKQLINNLRPPGMGGGLKGFSQAVSSS